MTSHTTEQFLELEAQVWEALVEGDDDADAHLLTDDFLGVYPSGFAGKADHTGQLQHGPTVARYQLSMPKLRVLAADLVLLSYRAQWTRVGNEADEAMYVTSIWQRFDDGWKNIFSQDTPAETPTQTDTARKP